MTSTRYDSYDEFLAADPRRLGDAFECGHDWIADDGTYRVCWYAQTRELTAEGLCKTEPLALEDFEHGVCGPVLVLHASLTRSQLEQTLGDWPTISRVRPRTLAALRRRLASVPVLRPVPDPPS